MKRYSECLKSIDIEDFNESVFNLIGKKWFLLTAGTPDNFNMMTASWGAMGILWNKPIAICFIRPSRHTFMFAEENDYYTMSFLGEESRSILNTCGATSGRETDKLKETGLMPLITENNGICYEQAELVIECKKVYFDDLKPVFILPENVDDKFYSDTDYHRMYIGEITGIYKK